MVFEFLKCLLDWQRTLFKDVKILFFQKLPQPVLHLTSNFMKLTLSKNRRLTSLPDVSPVYTTENFRHGSCEIGTGA